MNISKLERYKIKLNTVNLYKTVHIITIQRILMLSKE